MPVLRDWHLILMMVFTVVVVRAIGIIDASVCMLMDGIGGRCIDIFTNVHIAAHGADISSFVPSVILNDIKQRLYKKG